LTGTQEAVGVHHTTCNVSGPARMFSDKTTGGL